MDLRFIVVFFCCMQLALIGTTSTATLTSEDYWRSVLPNTQIPTAIQAKLSPPKSMVTGDIMLHPDNEVAGWYTSNAFLKDDLHPGNTMKLNFTMTTPAGITFLPRKEAEAIPFSSNSFSNVLKRFSVLPGSTNEQVMKKTIGDCETPALKVEKYCATSLESMIDYSVSKLGNNVQALSTEVDKEEENHKGMQKIMEYTITGDAEKMGSDDAILCHNKPYLYAVFCCHAAIGGTSVYRVPLVCADGRKALAIAVCDMKPGTPACHFLMEGHIAWVRNMEG